MSEQDFLRALDAEIGSALYGSGMGDTASYTPLVGDTVEGITVFVNRGYTQPGFDSQVVQPQIEIIIYRTDVSVPEYGATVTLGTGEEFKIDKIVDADSSISRCLVTE